MFIQHPPPFLYPKVLQLYHIGSLHLPEDPVRAAVLQAMRESDSKVLSTLVLSLKDKAVTRRQSKLQDIYNFTTIMVPKVRKSGCMGLRDRYCQYQVTF
jgi:hypothetical protein